MENIYAYFLIKLDGLLDLIISGESIDILFDANQEIMHLKIKSKMNLDKMVDTESKIIGKIIYLLSESNANASVINLFKVFMNTKENIGSFVYNKLTIMDFIVIIHRSDNISKTLKSIKAKNMDDLKLILLYISASFKNSSDLIEIILKENLDIFLNCYDDELEIFLTNIIWSSLMNFPDLINHFTSTNNLNKILISNEVFMTRLDAMNDPKEGLFFDEVAKKTRKYVSKPSGLTAYSLSFTTSKDYKQIPMWSLYTNMDGARLSYVNWLFNYALAFKDNNLTKMPIAGNVLYGEKKILDVIRWLNRMVTIYPKIIGTRDFVFRYLPFFSKVEDYSHEEEYRIVHVLKSDIGRTLKVESPILKMPYKYQWSPDLENSFMRESINKFFVSTKSTEEKNKLNWRSKRC